MPPRRPHPKSRRGCLPCKKSHLKCDEALPICSHCKRTGKKCERDLIFQTYDSKKGKSSHSLPHSSSNVLDCATPSPPQDLTFEDLGLMHFYTTSTCFTIAAQDSKLTETWQITVPQQANSHPYLMHALLSLAALHKVHLATNGGTTATTIRQSLDTAVKHHNLALAKSRSDLENLSEHNSSSLFALSATIAIFALALPISPASPPLRDPVEQIAQVAILMRGSRTIVVTGYDWIQTGPLASLLRHGFMRNTTPLPDAFETSLSQLEAEIYFTEKSEDMKMAYKETFEGLRACFRNAGFSADSDNVAPVEDRGVALSWLALMHSDFIPLISRRHPPALVLLSYYAIALHTLNSVWWCRGWGLALIKDVYTSLDDSWRAKMKWPIQQINGKYEESLES